jgi:hypothetical protein
MPLKLFPSELPIVGALGGGAAGPVFRQVGTTFVEPTGAEYEPTDGCTTDPYPWGPGDCASANVLTDVKAAATANVVSFMVFSFVNYVRDNGIIAIKFFAIELVFWQPEPTDSYSPSKPRWMARTGMK